MEFVPGTDIGGRYVIQRELGRGGFATVFAANHSTLGSTHALKVLHTSTPTLSQRLLSEGRAQAQLQHPNIVSVTDVVQLDQHVVLVMEFVDGPSLDAVLAARRLSLPEIDLIVRALLSGVAAAHERGLVHRDLKPANVLISCAGSQVQPKIADFGLVKVLGAEGAGLTASGVGMGTPAYMAPEQFTAASAVDERCDIYSLGCILYELCSGRRATIGDGVFQLALIAETGDRPAISEMAPQTPPRLAALIDEALSPEPEHRPKSVAVMLERWTAASTSEADAHRTLADLASGASAVPRQPLSNSTMTSLTGQAHVDEPQGLEESTGTVQIAISPNADAAVWGIAGLAGLIWAALMAFSFLWMMPPDAPSTWPALNTPQPWLFAVPGLLLPVLAGYFASRVYPSPTPWRVGATAGALTGAVCAALITGAGAGLLGNGPLYAATSQGRSGNDVVATALAISLVSTLGGVVSAFVVTPLIGAVLGLAGSLPTAPANVRSGLPKARAGLWTSTLISALVAFAASSLAMSGISGNIVSVAADNGLRSDLITKLYVGRMGSSGQLGIVILISIALIWRAFAADGPRSERHFAQYLRLLIALLGPPLCLMVSIANAHSAVDYIVPALVLVGWVAITIWGIRSYQSGQILCQKPKPIGAAVDLGMLIHVDIAFGITMLFFLQMKVGWVELGSVGLLALLTAAVLIPAWRRGAAETRELVASTLLAAAAQSILIAGGGFSLSVVAAKTHIPAISALTDARIGETPQIAATVQQTLGGMTLAILILFLAMWTLMFLFSFGIRRTHAFYLKKYA